MDPTRISTGRRCDTGGSAGSSIGGCSDLSEKSHNEARLLKEQLDSAIKTDERRISFFRAWSMN